MAFQHLFKVAAVIALTYNALNASDCCSKSTFTQSKADILYLGPNMLFLGLMPILDRNKIQYQHISQVSMHPFFVNDLSQKCNVGRILSIFEYIFDTTIIYKFLQ